MSIKASILMAARNAIMHMEYALLAQERVSELMKSSQNQTYFYDIIAIELINNISKNNLMFYENLIVSEESDYEIEP